MFGDACNHVLFHVATCQKTRGGVLLWHTSCSFHQLDQLATHLHILKANLPFSQNFLQDHQEKCGGVAKSERGAQACDKKAVGMVCVLWACGCVRVRMTVRLCRVHTWHVNACAHAARQFFFLASRVGGGGASGGKRKKGWTHHELSVAKLGRFPRRGSFDQFVRLYTYTTPGGHIK